MYKILLCDQLSHTAIQILNNAPDVQYKELTGFDEKTLIKHVKEFNAIIVRSSTQITSKILNSAENLKVIGRAGTGLDNIDLESAAKKGIKVLNTPGSNAPAVAELTLAYMFNLARKIIPANNNMREGKWDKKAFQGIELSGKKLGIIGYGRVGKRVAALAASLGMEILLFDHSHIESENPDYLPLPWEKLFKESDFITLHIPLTEQTKHLVGNKEFSLMKETAFIINTARGGIINEKELLEAINSNKIAGAALDVFENEPDFNRELVQSPNVIATPHIAAASIESQERVGVIIIDQVLEYLRSKYIFF
jgi:D-3-phosphoglycerate dehydrogenase